MSEKMSQKLMAFGFGKTYFHQTFTKYVSNHIFWNFDIPDVITSYERFFGSIGCLKILMFDTLFFTKFCGELMKIISTCHSAIHNCSLWQFIEHKGIPM